MNRKGVNGTNLSRVGNGSAASAVQNRPQAIVPHRASVAQALTHILEQQGVRYIFGVPGGPLTALFEAVKGQGAIEFVLAKHETGAAYMAAAHSRVTGQLSVCCATSGPGATNALTGIAGAFADSVPVLFLSGQVSTAVFGKGAIQESTVFGTDLVRIFAPVTKLSTALPSPERAVATLHLAIRTALTGRMGPVHLSMPADFLRRQVPFETSSEARQSPASITDQDAVRRAARMLVDARRPLILAGHGVAQAQAWTELAELARALPTLVVTSPKGKGVFPETDPLSLGVLGFGGHRAAEEAVRSGNVDTLLVVGSSLNEFVTDAWTIPIAPKQLIQADIDPVMIGRNYPVDVAIVGDAKTTLRELTKHATELRDGRLRSVPPLADPTPAQDRYLAAAAMESDASPIKPQRLVRELREAMPDDAMLFVDNGTAIIWAGHYFETRQPATYFIDLGLASMGSAVAGVVGGALAAPHRRAVALVGDAAFAMHGFEVHTAVELRVPVVWVVLNNSGHGMVHQGDTLMHGAPLGVSDFGTAVDAAAIGRSLGARGVVVRDPLHLRLELEAALRAAGPTVIDALIDPKELVPTLERRVRTLSRYFSEHPSRRSEPVPK